MKPHEFASTYRGTFFALLFGGAILFSNMALAQVSGGYDQEIAKGNTSYTKTTEQDANGGYTERTYYNDPNGGRQLVEIRKYPKGGKKPSYTWFRTTDGKGGTITEEFSASGAGVTGTKEVIDKDGNKTTYHWDNGNWRFTSYTPKASGPGVKNAPTGPQVELNPSPENNRFQIGVGYIHMETDGEEVGQLDGFTVSGFYNVTPWLAVGGEFSGLYGSRMNNFFGGSEDISLDRYLYLFGARVSAPSGEPVKPYAQVLFGGVHDSSDFSFAGGSSSTSADAFAMSVGIGVDFQVTNSFSIGPSVDWVPTFFSGGSGPNRQDNWRFGLNANYRFGGRR